MSGPIITGIGALAPHGAGTEEFWRAALDGRHGIGPVTLFDASRYPSTLAGEIQGLDPVEHLPSRLVPQTDRVTRLSLVAAARALEDADVDPAELDEHAAGVITASTAGGFDFGQRELENLWSKGPKHVSAYQSYAWFYAVNTGQISIRHGMRGPSGVVVSDQAGGLDAIAQARRRLRAGSSLIMSGGVDSALCPWGWVAQMADGRMSTATDPEKAFLPFDDRAAGYVPGEGGALLVLEDAAMARSRGAREYGEVAGYGATTDPRPGSHREPTLRVAIETALTDAGIAAEDVDAVFADAAGLPAADHVESAALAAVFGAHAVPVTAPKAATGRLGAGGAGLDVAAALLSMRDGLLPPTANSVLGPGHDIDLVTERARAVQVRHALVVARGRGGFNSALVLRAPS